MMMMMMMMMMMNPVELFTLMFVSVTSSGLLRKVAFLSYSCLSDICSGCMPLSIKKKSDSPVKSDCPVHCHICVSIVSFLETHTKAGLYLRVCFKSFVLLLWFSSMHFHCTGSGKPMCAAPRLSEFPRCCLLKVFQCWSD